VLGYVSVLSWLRSSIGKLKTVAKLFEGRHFNREVSAARPSRSI
jgi:hypothetical protein